MPNRPPQHFPPPGNHGSRVVITWWLHPYCWRSPVHTSVPCTALSLTRRSNGANMEPELHESRTTDTRRPARILACCQRFAAANSPSLFWVDWLFWNVILNRQQLSVSPPHGVCYFFQSVIQFLIILWTSHKKMTIFANLNPPSVHFGVLWQATLVGLSRYWKAMEGLFAYSCVAKIYRDLLLEYLYKTSAACLPSTVLWLHTSSK